MGQRIAALALQDEAFQLVAAVDRSGHPLLGQDIGSLAAGKEVGVKVTDSLSADAEVLIDFSLPAGAISCAQFCRKEGIPLVVGTTGMGEAEKQRLREASAKIPIVVAANMSLGVNLLFKLAGQVAQALGDAYDIEIVETHHRFKKDAPSGTALELARQIAQAKSWDFPACLEHGREGKESLRRDKTIGMHAVRLGDTVGDHSVCFGALGETIELRHSAHTRDTFAHGALHAARWIANQPAGWYNMCDVLGL